MFSNKGEGYGRGGVLHEGEENRRRRCTNLIGFYQNRQNESKRIDHEKKETMKNQCVRVARDDSESD